MQRSIPHYGLYGDTAHAGWSNSLNFEWIPERSAPYGWEIQPHVHEAFVQVLWLTQGSVEAHFNDVRHHLAAPCLLVVPAQTVHGFRFSPDVLGPVVTATQKPLESLAQVVMPELLAFIRTPAALSLAGAPDHLERLMPLFLAMEREFRTPALGQVAAGMSLLMAVLVQGLRVQQRHSAAQQPSVTSRKAAQIERFRALVDARFRTRPSVADCAQGLGVTAGQLTRLCHEVLGMSGLDVINARTVHEAQRDLVYTATTVKQLAAALGFEDEAYFSRFFKKQTGRTPTEFRAHALQAMQAG